MKSQPKIILASTSPQRINILRQAGFEFEVIPSDYPEIDEPFLSPLEQAKKHAFNKAKAVADILKEGYIIGCDTVVCLDSKLIGKPRDLAHAKEIIQSQQGRTFEVISGLTIFNASQERNMTVAEVTKVSFKPMTEAEIDWYLSTEEYKDKSGGFSIQGLGSRFISRIEGDYQNVVGLPVYKVYELLKLLNYPLDLQLKK
jgi:septum formation protein